MSRLIFRSEVFQEGNLWVGLCPDLDVSSFGDTPAEAQESLQESVEAFLEGCNENGSLVDILTESGYVLGNDAWQIRERILKELETTVA